MAENVLFEIGLEELPARFVDDAERQLKEKTVAWLKEERLAFDSVTSFSTPRRLAVIVENISPEQEMLEEEVRGPALNIAKDENGKWTKAAIGFAKGQGKTVDDLIEKEVKGKTYVFVLKQIEGKATESILPDFANIITSLTFSSHMRWGTHAVRFARPIRWLVGLYGKTVIPFEVAGVKSRNVTYGHRYLGKPFELEEATDYEEKLKENYVIADSQKRKQWILNGIKELENKHDFRVIVDDDLLAEVNNLVEYPTVFYGSFAEEFLNLPQQVLKVSMKEHQRYFPVISNDGDLLPHFISVRNGDTTALETVIKGNEKVLRARLSDAEFFYEEDRKHTIDHYLEKLDQVVFQEKLGSLAEKVARVSRLTQQISEKLELSSEAAEDVTRAAEIGKFDLMTNMVDEFPELQGVMGEIYAQKLGEKPEVARAIREQYLPTHAKGKLPETDIGAVLSVAEKLDTIAGIIAVGLMPTGSQDPYALRRQAIGVLRILQEKNWNVTLEEMLNFAYELYDGLELEKAEDYRENIHDFFKQRAAFLLKEMGIEQDIVEAVMGNHIGNFAYSVEKAKLLSEKRHDETFKEKEEALVRVLNLSIQAKDGEINPKLFETDSEKELYEKYKISRKMFEKFNANLDAENAFKQLESLAQPIHNFFDNNMVMADNVEIRTNRLALVSALSKMIKTFADLTVIEWKQSF